MWLSYSSWQQCQSKSSTFQKNVHISRLLPTQPQYQIFQRTQRRHDDTRRSLNMNLVCQSTGNHVSFFSLIELGFNGADSPCGLPMIMCSSHCFAWATLEGNSLNAHWNSPVDSGISSNSSSPEIIKGQRSQYIPLIPHIVIKAQNSKS